MVRKKVVGLIIALLVMSGFTFHVSGQLFDQNFEAEPDVEAVVKADEGIILFKFGVMADHHITDLKNNFFKIEVQPNDYIEVKETVFPKGVPYADEMVFQGDFDVTVYVKPLKEITEPVTLKFKISYQICQEKPQEVCFPPTSMDLNLKVDKPLKEGRQKAAAEQTEAVAEEDEGFIDGMIGLFEEELEKESFLLFLIVFLLGFLTSLTGCIYPIIPIIMGYVGARTGGSKIKGFYLSIFFVVGLAIVYSTLGVIAGATGGVLGGALQEPIVILVISAIFIAMGFSLAGFFEIPVPTSLSSKVQGGQKSGIVGAMIFGGVAGIMAAPCAGPVLVGLLTFIAQTQKIFFGFLLTLTFSLGMGMIFLIVGTFTGVVSAMPKGGQWMNNVKYFFSLLLMGGGLYFLGTITADWLINFLWGVFLVGAAVFMGLFKAMEEDAENKAKVFRTILALLFIIGAFLVFKSMDMRFFGGTSGGKATGAYTAAHAPLPWVKDLEKGKEQAKAENKMLMVDSYADWCVACKKLDANTWNKPEVIERLKKDFIIVKLDFTKNTEANKQLEKDLDIKAHPTIIFYKPDGTEINRFFGFKNKEEFLKFLDKKVK